MTNQHPITPPPELVQQWEADWHCSGNTNGNGFTYFVATRAAQWGADQELEACIAWQELEACCEWLMYEEDRQGLRAARRPKPYSLKEEAFLALEALLGPTKGGANAETIRRALEQLND